MGAQSIVKKTLYRFNLNGESFNDLLDKGGYDYVNSKIKPANFPDFSLVKKRIEIRVINTSQFSNGSSIIGTDDILYSFENQGLEPAGITELLAFGAEYPNVQRERCIIALGSLIPSRNDNKYAPCLWGSEDERGIGVVWLKGGWNNSDNFAAI